MSTYGTEAARQQLFTLLDAGEASLITREAGQGEVQRAVLVPLARLTAEQRQEMPTWPSHGLTEARRNLGDLVRQTSAGARQVLTRHGRPVAALLPHGAALSSTEAARRSRTLTAPADALPVAAGRASLSYGLADLDEETGGLTPGRLVLVAAAPGNGGSLLAAGPARTTALTAGRPVLYAASGPSAADVTARITAAHAGVHYQRLRAGAFHATVEVTAAVDAVRGAPLFIDDGTDLDVDALAQTVPDIDGLALLVVDRLQAEPDPAVPLSGEALPGATRALARLARARDIPVLAAVDTDDPARLAELRADVVLLLQRDGEMARLTVAEADMVSHGISLPLTPDFARARFLDGDTHPRPATTAPQPPTEPVPAASSPAPSPTETATPTETSQDETPARSRRRTADRADLASFIPDRVERALEKHDGDVQAALTYLAGEPNKAGQSIEHVMELWEMTRVGGRYDPTAYPELPDPLIRKRKGNADEVWEARTKFTNPDPSLQGRMVTPLDVNGAYLSALGAATLPVRSLTHNPAGTDHRGRTWSWENPDDYGRGANLAGIVQLDQIDWPHTTLPHPLGDDRETKGRLWVPTSVFAKLKDAVRLGLLDQLPRIRAAYTAPGTDGLFKTLVNILRDARTRAITEDDHLTKAYVAKMYAVLVSTIGDSPANHHIKRPDWEHLIRGHAFANLWRKALRAHQAGLTVAYAGGTDELHLAATPEDVFSATADGGKRAFEQGTALNEIKIKPGADPYEWHGRAVRH